MKDKKAFLEALREYGVLTKDTLPEALREYGVVTQKELKSEILASEKRQDKKMKAMEKRLITKISHVAVNSPTFDQFKELERKVDRLSN